MKKICKKKCKNNRKGNKKKTEEGLVILEATKMQKSVFRFWKEVRNQRGDEDGTTWEKRK